MLFFTKNTLSHQRQKWPLKFHFTYRSQLVSRVVLSFGKELSPLTFIPNDNVVDWSKLKPVADDKLGVAHMVTCGLERIEDIMGKGEMLLDSIFFFSHNVFQGLIRQGLHISRVR